MNDSLNRVVLPFVVFACFTSIGWFIYRDFKQRKQFFESFITLCDNLTTEIRFSKRTVSEIIDNSADSYCKPFKAVLTGYRELISTNHDITRDTLEPHIWQRLRQPERMLLIDFFIELGRHDVTEEIDKIARKKSHVQIFHTQASEALRRDASIYFKICILLGIAVAIILL